MDKKFITCILKGGLGNQLFQIFTTLSLSIDNHIPFHFLNIKKLDFQRETYWDSFLSTLSEHTIENYPKEYLYYQEHFFHYEKIPQSLFVDGNQSILINGYFQSFHYFIKNWKLIQKKIGWNEKVNEVLKNHQIDHLHKITSMHFRFGDYTQLQDYHPILPIEYYIESIQQIQENTNVILCFYQKEDERVVSEYIQTLKNHYPSISFVSINHDILDWEQLIIMSQTKNQIIANSTFSWWGAFLNKNKKKKVFYPSVWFGKKCEHHSLDDLFPKKWICVKWNE
jgi:hypothetical protein